MTRVVNKRVEPYEIYIGRGSKWGNPFVIGRDGTREEVIAKYRKYILNNLCLMSQLGELKDKVLGCFCKPLACHGDVLVELAEMDKIGVVGSRTFRDYERLEGVLEKFLPFILVSGGAKGADSLAGQFAFEHKLPKIIHLPNWAEYGRSAGPIRNSLIIADSDKLVAFWDGKSKGTRDSINKAEEKGIPVLFIEF